LGNPNYFDSSIFRNIQELQGYISPGILAVFVCGLVFRRAPAMAGVVGLLANPVLYGLITFTWPQIPFLDRMAICFFAVIGLILLMRFLSPLPRPVEFRAETTIDLTSSRGAFWAGMVVMGLAISLYVVFW
jgi:SSS family solute:Na+ symporter